MTALPSWISATGLAWKARERWVLGPLDFVLESGLSTVLIGPNGAGKTTLLRLLAGVLRPSEGTLSFAGTPYESYSRRELARRIAYVPQVRPERVPFTVRELVLQGRFPHLPPLAMTPSRSDVAAVEEALERAGVAALATRPLDELSGGERQAAYIAAALAQQAPVLLLDEPTTHLDPRHQRSVVRLVQDLAASGDCTVLMATHDLRVAAAVAGRVVALRQGQVMASGSPAEMLAPDLLSSLFEAPFRRSNAQDMPVTLLELGAP